MVQSKFVYVMNDWRVAIDHLKLIVVSKSLKECNRKYMG